MSVLSDQTKDFRPYIGRYGYKDSKGKEVPPVEPQLCAVTGQKAPRGRACTNISLGNGYYYRVLAKAVHQADKPAIVKELEKAMSVLAGKQPKLVTGTKKDDKS